MTNNELALLAQQGNRAATDALARAVWPWVVKKASVYSRAYGCEQEDLQSVGLSSFPAALRGYDPDHGGFLNYFAFAASRAMLAAARREQRSRERTVHFPDGVDAPALIGDEPPVDRERVAQALDSLDPLSREIVRQVVGFDGHGATVVSVATRLGITLRRAHVLYRTALQTLAEMPELVE